MGILTLRIIRKEDMKANEGPERPTAAAEGSVKSEEKEQKRTVGSQTLRTHLLLLLLMLPIGPVSLAPSFSLAFAG